jgi:uncharacterized protein with NAD-binding domain and iron-sulfur cluster
VFTPVHEHTFLEQVDDGWMPWSYRFRGSGVLPGAAIKPELPGSVPMLPGVWGSAHRVLSWIRVIVQSHPRFRSRAPSTAETAWMSDTPPWRSPEQGPVALPGGLALIDVLTAAMKRVAASRRAPLSTLARLVVTLRRGLLAPFKDSDDVGVRRLRVMLDLCLTGLKGLLDDEIPRRGYHSIDDEEFRAWLRRHGASAEAIEAPIIRTLYDILFAYEDGDVARPAVAAGALLRSMFRLLFSYHGAVLWKMNAGMGDAIIAPLYELLKARGVQFRFFHAVEALELSADQQTIDGIQLRRQARPRGGAGTYSPLVVVKGLQCWPNAPRFEQLEDGASLRAEAVNFERLDTSRGELTRLQRGVAFDQVVLGISLAGLPKICAELAAARPAWREMFQHLGTVRTQALQLWFTEPYAAQGAAWPSGMLASYVQPFSSWSDFSQVIPHEDWPVDDAPAYLAYSCGVLPDAPEGPPDDATATLAVHETAARWLEAHAGPMWPAAVTRDGRFCWERLHDLEHRVGAARLSGQYVRANTHPTERYVQALPGTTKYRLPPGASGFDNLVLTGAWTDNHYTLSCIEATVMSGMMAARAVDGRPRRIVGEGDV